MIFVKFAHKDATSTAAPTMIRCDRFGKFVLLPFHVTCFSQPQVILILMLVNQLKFAKSAHQEDSSELLH